MGPFAGKVLLGGVHKVIEVEPRSSGKNGGAFGRLYWDDGESVYSNYSTLPPYFYHFVFRLATTQDTAALTIVNDHVGNPQVSLLEQISVSQSYVRTYAKEETYKVPTYIYQQYGIPHLNVVELLGYHFVPLENTFQLDGQPISPTVEADAVAERSYISQAGLVNLGDLARGEHTLQWRHTK